MGDRVRIMRLPSEFSREGYYVDPDTVAFYERLISERAIVTVFMLDDWGTPWISYDYDDDDGQEGFHILAINDDSWEPLEPEE